MQVGERPEEVQMMLSNFYQLIDGEKVELDGDVMQVAMLLQEMPEELRKVAMEQVRVLRGLWGMNTMLKWIYWDLMLDLIL